MEPLGKTTKTNSFSRFLPYFILFYFCIFSIVYIFLLLWGSVYTSAVSLVTASFSMRLRLLFTRHQSRPLPKSGRFENAAKKGAFSKRYGFICRVNGETASIWEWLPLWREICILRFKMVNLARSLALACAITSHHICFSSLKRSKISLYFLLTDSQSIPSAVLLTLYSLVTFKRSSTSSSVQVNRDVLFAMLRRTEW